jgi:O-antigen/teichoic acid export membrane protein
VATLASRGWRRGSLGSDLVLNVGSQFALRVVTAVTALYAARVLGPARFGTWAVLQVLFLYTAQGHFGTVNAMMREVPMALSRGKAQAAQELVNSSWGFVTLSSVVVAIASGAVTWWMRVPGESGWNLVVIGSVLLVLLQLQSTFFQFYCRAYGSFRVLAGFNLAQAGVTLPLCFWLVRRMGIGGYLLALCAGFAVISVAVVTRPGLKLRFSPTDWKRLLGIGLPMLPGSLMLYLNMSLERVVLAYGVSTAAVGVFVAGAFFFQIGGTLWELLIYTLYSRLAELYSATGEIDFLAAALRGAIPGAVWVSSIAQGALFITLPYALARMLPEYSQSGTVAQVLVLVMNVWGIAQLLNFSMTIIGGERSSLALQGVFVVVKLALLGGAVALSGDPVSAAVASFVSLVFYAGHSWWWWRKVAGVDLGSLREVVALWALPSGIAVICGWNLQPDIWDVIFRAIAYAAIVSVLSLAVQKKSNALGRLWACKGLA